MPRRFALVLLAAVSLGTALAAHSNASRAGGPAPDGSAAEPATREVRIELAVPSPDGYEHLSIVMLALREPGVDPVARAAQGRAAMLARFPGAIELSPGGASAQHRIFGIRWPGASITWRYNPASAPAFPQAGGALEPIVAGAQAWSAAGGANWRFEYNGTTATATGCDGRPTAIPRDGQNVVGWGHTAGGYLGYSCWWRSDRFVPGTPYFEATEFDIVLEPGHPHTALSLQSLALHEFGHALGLDHTENRLCPGAAMCDGADALTYPQPQRDDILGLIALYGLAPPAPEPPPPGPRPHRIQALMVSRD